MCACTAESLMNTSNGQHTSLPSDILRASSGFTGVQYCLQRLLTVGVSPSSLQAFLYLEIASTVRELLSLPCVTCRQGSCVMMSFVSGSVGVSL